MGAGGGVEVGVGVGVGYGLESGRKVKASAFGVGAAPFGKGIWKRHLEKAFGKGIWKAGQVGASVCPCPLGRVSAPAL